MRQTIAITGATAGIGAAMARLFAREGARLVLIARRKDRLDALAKELGPDRTIALAADITEPIGYVKALHALPSPYREIDILVNNAGMALARDPAHKSRLEDWLVMLDTNIKGLVAGTHAVLPGMVERGRGHIINIGSTAGVYPNPGNAIYGPTKSFVRQFSLNLRADLLGEPIRVTDIEPGLVGGTEFSEVRYRGDKTSAAAWLEGVKALSAEDVAEAALWAITRPAHVNINIIQLMPVDQAFAPPAMHRRKSA